MNPFTTTTKPNTLSASTKPLLNRQIYITALILSSGYMGEKFIKIETRSTKIMVDYLKNLVISADDIALYTNFWIELNIRDLKSFMFGWMIQIKSLKKFPIEIPDKEIEQKKFFSWMCTDEDIPKKGSLVK